MIPKPQNRSPLRMKLGVWYFTLKRYGHWYLSNTRFAREKWHGTLENSPFTHLVFKHRSVLLRNLRNVDMWLQYNKIHNLRLAIPRLDGLLLRPGETFSYWKLLGKPSKRKGYKQGMELVGGGFRPAYGGGLCQLSNLLYWMTLHTPLTVTERYRHQFDVFPDSDRTLPFGSGATCSYNYIDLQIRNDTNQTFYLHLHLTDTHLVGEWWSDQPPTRTYHVYEKEHRIIQAPWGGYIRYNQIWRKIFDTSGDLIDDQFLLENHAIMMYSPLLDEPSKRK
jgi:vancomycin resistance protein VanW